MGFTVYVADEVGGWPGDGEGDAAGSVCTEQAAMAKTITIEAIKDIPELFILQ